MRSPPPPEGDSFGSTQWAIHPDIAGRARGAYTLSGLRYLLLNYALAKGTFPSTGEKPAGGGSFISREVPTPGPKSLEAGDARNSRTYRSPGDIESQARSGPPLPYPPLRSHRNLAGSSAAGSTRHTEAQLYRASASEREGPATPWVCAAIWPEYLGRAEDDRHRRSCEYCRSAAGLPALEGLKFPGSEGRYRPPRSSGQLVI